MTSPSAALQHLVDQVADDILFGGPLLELENWSQTQRVRLELPAALGSLVVDVMARAASTNRQLVERRLITEFHSRLDQRVRTAIEDDIAAERWRVLRAGLEARFPTCH